MYREPERLARADGASSPRPSPRYVRAKAAAGADAIQLFDSWVGALSVSDYEEFVAPYSARVLAAVGRRRRSTSGPAPRTCSARWPPPAAMRSASTGASRSIEGWLAVGPEKAVQGNLDPAVLLGPWERIEAAALDVLARAGGRPGHVFNLGHGVLPETDPDDLWPAGRARASEPNARRRSNVQRTTASS